MVERQDSWVKNPDKEQLCEIPVMIGADLGNCVKGKSYLSINAFQNKNVEISLKNTA